MDPKEKRSPLANVIGIHYYHGPSPYKLGPEVRFPRVIAPEEDKKSLQTTQPDRVVNLPGRPVRYHNEWMPLAIVVALASLFLFWLILWGFYLEAKAMPQPPPEIVPAHPALFQVIRAKNQFWVYYGPFGWVDP